MTNNLKEEIDNILGSLAQESYMYGVNPEDFGKAPTIEEATEAILALINQKEKESRLDEYAWYKREYPTAPYMPDFIIEDRIKQLKEELKGGKD